MRGANYYLSARAIRGSIFDESPTPTPATMTSSGPVPASFWTQKKSINNDRRHSAFPFLVRRFKIVAHNASEPCAVLERPAHHLSHCLSHQLISKPVQPFLFSLDLAKAPPPPPCKISLETAKVPRARRQRYTSRSMCRSTWEQVLVCLEIPSLWSTALENPKVSLGIPRMALFLWGVSKPHKKGREYRKDHVADRVRAEERLVWSTQRYL